MFGLSSGCAVTVREMITTANHFEQILARFCDSFRIEDTKILVKPDPRDPRKKMRVPEAEFKRQLFLPAGSAVNSGQLEAPVDLVSSLALLTLAAMRRHDYVLPGMAINRVSNKFLNYLKTSGIEVTVSDKADRGDDVIGTVAIKGKGLKAKKLSGEQSGILIDEIPFMAAAAVLGNGTTIIRDIGEFADLGVDPFEEIVDKLGTLGVKCGLLEDGLVIEGIKEINGTDFGSFRNHKIALAFAVAAMCGQGHSTFDNLDLIQLHYPKLSTVFET
jgi:3-phosphoshikimate 1-carboxyvinyltransferase